MRSWEPLEIRAVNRHRQMRHRRRRMRTSLRAIRAHLPRCDWRDWLCQWGLGAGEFGDGLLD